MLSRCRDAGLTIVRLSWRSNGVVAVSVPPPNFRQKKWSPKPVCL
jgi:hypothetical protein